MPVKRELTARQLRHLLRLHHDGVSTGFGNGQTPRRFHGHPALGVAIETLLIHLTYDEP